jgi:hypothetical protein
MVEQGPWAREVKDYHPDRTALVRLDGFLSQKVLCFNGQWVSRGDAIKYIANVAHGVHSTDPKAPNHELLKKIRYIATISLEGGKPLISFDPKAVATDEKPLAVNRRALDFILLQLMSAARYLTISPDILRLEDIIRQETL